ncbi:MAG: hypothetical protein Q9163_004870 [Psora crenata]
MPIPSPLSIATSSITRLLKEEDTYRAEVVAQEERIRRLHEEGIGTGAGATGQGRASGKEEEEDGYDDRENVKFILRQETQALAETKAVFAPLRNRIVAATEKLEVVLCFFVIVLPHVFHKIPRYACARITDSVRDGYQADNSDGVDPAEVKKAKEALAKAKGG